MLGARPLLGGPGRAFSLEVASFAQTKKFSEAPEVLRARFFARLGRLCARTCWPEVSQNAPGFDFRAGNHCFLDVFAGLGTHPSFESAGPTQRDADSKAVWQHPRSLHSIMAAS